MINTHKKLIETVLEKQVSKEILFNILKDYGYKGDIESIIPDLLYATVNSDAYMYDSQKKWAIRNWRELEIHISGMNYK